MDPERPIEKLLRDHARKRREDQGADFELHPATRKMLRDEAARTLGAKRAKEPARSGGAAAFWPRLLWATAILAVLGVAVFVLFPPESKNDTYLAQNGLEPMSPPAVSSAPEPALRQDLPASSPQPTFFKPADKDSLLDSGQFRVTELAKSAPAKKESDSKISLADSANAPAERQPAAHYAQPGGFVESKAPVSNEIFNLGMNKLATAAPAPASAGAAAPIAAAPAPAGTVAPTEVAAAVAPKTALKETTTLRAEVATNSLAARDDLQANATLSQHFEQIQLVTKAKARVDVADESRAAPPVLAAFQVEQSGDTLRIIDSDGSIYTGRVTKPELEQVRLAESRNRALSAARPAQSGSRAFEGGAALSQSVSFTVSGTNHSLNQNLVFNGTLSPATNGSFGFSDAGRKQQPANPLANSRISGSAQIGRSKTVAVDAVPTP